VSDEFLQEFRRSITINVKLSARVKQLEARLAALESVPKLDSTKVSALERKIDDVILTMKVRR
jgi:hypothetical protein